jgi:hypothetical protein
MEVTGKRIVDFSLGKQANVPVDSEFGWVLDAVRKIWCKQKSVPLPGILPQLRDRYLVMVLN